MLREVSAQRHRFDFEQGAAFEAFTDDLPEFWSDLDRLIALHQADDWRRDAFLVKSEVAPLVDQISDTLQALVERQQVAMRHANEAVVAIYGNERAGIQTGVLLFALGGWSFYRDLVRETLSPRQEAGRAP